MNPNSLKILVMSALFVAAANIALAQNKTYNEEITVVAPYNPIIPDAFKITQNPDISDSLAKKPLITYNVAPLVAQVTPELQPISAARLAAETKPQLTRNYIKGGFGNYAMLYGELFVNSIRSQNNLLTFRLKHHSANGEIKNYVNPANSINQAELNGIKYFTQHTLAAKAFFDRRAIHYYGIQRELTENANFPDLFKQRYTTLGGEASLKSHYTTNDRLNHAINLGFYHIGSKRDISEAKFTLGAILDKQFDILHWDKNQTIGLAVGGDYLFQRDSRKDFKSGLITLQPFIKAQYKEYSFMAGLRFNAEADSAETKAHLYPTAEARLELIPQALKIYAGIDGGLKQNTLRNFIAENPFMSNVVNWKNTNERIKVYGGFMSNISRTFNFNASISNATIDDMPLFYNQWVMRHDINSYNVLYDDVVHTQLKGELEFIKPEWIRLALTGIYNHYKLSAQPHAWYKPEFQLEFAGRYQFRQLTFNLKTTYNSPVWAWATPHINPDIINIAMPTAQAHQLKSWVDVSLGAEYRIYQKLSGWISINNLTGQKYYRWYNYPSYGFNAMIGATYSF